MKKADIRALANEGAKRGYIGPLCNAQLNPKEFEISRKRFLMIGTSKRFYQLQKEYRIRKIMGLL